MKNSGIEWIGEIPDDWEIYRIKNIATIAGRIGWQGLTSQEYSDEGAYLITGINFLNGTIDWKSCVHVPYSRWEEATQIQIKNDDLLITKDGTVGKIAIVKDVHDKTTLNSGVMVIRQNKTKCDTKYLYYILSSDIFWKWFYFINSGNSTIIHLYQQDFYNFSFPLPNIEIQSLLSSKLEKNCSRIEKTMQNQLQVIEKLKAYKQSLITEAVTGKIKIQNGKVCGKYESYKESGVEYLGKIPSNWNVKRLRYIGKCQNGISKGGEFFGSGYPFVSYGDVYNNLTLPETVSGLIESTPEEQENYSVKAGDIFFTRTSETIEEVGFTSVCLKTIENATFAGFVIRVRPFTYDLIPEYSKYYFSSDAHRRFFVKEMNLVTRASLSQDLLKRLPVLIPSKEDQKEIADYLDKKCTAIDTAIEQKQKLIEKLTEYKKSLIYECVTGKKVV